MQRIAWRFAYRARGFSVRCRVPKSVSGDWLPSPEIARNRANSRVSQESKFEPGLVGWSGRIRTSVFWIRPFSQIGHQRLFAHELQTSETQRRSAFGWDRACAIAVHCRRELARGDKGKRLANLRLAAGGPGRGGAGQSAVR